MVDLEKLCDNLFRIVNNSDPYLQEFDIIDLRPNEVEFIYEENCLVINKIYLKKLYFYLKEQFLKRNELKLSDFKRDQLSILILLINPQFSSVWSQRKELVCLNFIEIEHEFKINSLILDKNVKSEHGYMHRRWLIKRLDIKNVEEFVRNESDMVYRLSRKIKSNYYCWSYLNWVFEYFKDKLINRNFMIDILDKHQKNVLDLSVSDFCVFHFRLNLFKLLFRDIKMHLDDELVKLIVNEFNVFDDLLIRYSKYQTVWNYRKYFYRILDACQLNSDILDNNDVISLFHDFKSNLLNDENLIRTQLSGCFKKKSNFLSCLLNREIVLTEFLKNTKKSDDEKLVVENYAKLHCEFLRKFFTIE